MANINFNKLGLKVNSEIKSFDWNGQIIEVKQYLPIQDKLHIMEEVISLSMTPFNYANPVQVEVYTYICIIKYYTNIKFTDKQLETPAKIYDMIKSSGLLSNIDNSLPDEEKQELLNGIENSIKAFYDYRTSLLGILDCLKSDYSATDLDLNSIMNYIKDPEALSFLKQIAPLLNQGQS